MRIDFKLAIICLLATGLCACTFIEKDVGAGFKREGRAMLASAEKLSVDDILDELGPPHQLVALPDGYAFLYQKFDIRERQLGLSSDAPLLRWFKISLADAGSTSQAFVARFDEDDNLIAGVVATNSEELGEAGGLIFAFNFLSQVDSSDLDSDLWGATKWGMFLLQEPNILLNAANNPDLNANALDQRGTPTNVGQRTMDHRRPNQ